MTILELFYLLVLSCFFSLENESIKEIPSIYIKPEVREIFYDYPLIIENGYVFLDNKNKAQGFFDPIPPEANFDRQNIIIFAWKGSGQDKIDYEYDNIGKIHNFVYKRGLTKDHKEHVKIISINKEEKWLFHRVLD